MEKSELEKLVKDERNEELMAVITITMLQNIEASKLTDNSGMTLLHLAVKHNNLKLMKYLLDMRFDVNARDIYGSTPLAIAVFYEKFDAMDVLLQSNADIFGTDHEGTCTMKILLSKWEKLPNRVVKRIVDNYKGNKLDSETKVKILSKCGCSLLYVLFFGDDSVTRIFLKQNFEIGSNELFFAMQFVMARQDAVNVRVLIEYAEFMYPKRGVFFEVLCQLVISKESRVVRSAELFLKLSMEWNVIDEFAVQFFEFMFEKADKEGLQILLDSNVDVYIRNKFGVEVLIGLFANPNVDAAELLKNRAFFVNWKKSSGHTALHMAVENASEKNVRFLLDIGADPNVKISNETTVLSMVSGNKSHVELLLQYGADVQLATTLHRLFRIIKSDDALSYVVAQLVIDEARDVPSKNWFRFGLQDIIDNQYYCNTYRNCYKQIEDLKKCKLTDTVTLFELLTEKTEVISRRLRGEDCLSKLEDYCQKCEVHPFYQSTLKFKLLRASKMHCAKTIFGNIFTEVVFQMTGIPVATDHLVMERIFSFLTYYDMLQLA